ncbi:MAG TPA: GMC family oxidoreductase [Candidatus Polarisedimenticolia bacterium]|nr:GMC family oxidoreductase [Candidatus Polarisedimenticolia bacterium]
MKTLPSVDVVIIGGGWTGLLMAKELGSRTALSVVVLERGGPRKSDEYGDDMDELDYTIRFRMMQDVSQETVTLRHDSSQRALPLRQHGSFLPGSGVGGAGEHWSAVCPRFLPDCFELLSHSIEKYGSKRLPEDHAIQDWGVTYDELEPHYTRADLLLGISGKAGNIRGKQIEGGNIFEGWRSAEYPTPPTKIPYFSSMFAEAAKSLGYHPYPVPAATTSRAYTNPDGVSRPGCTYCGYCETFGCMIGAKSQPTNTLLPVIEKHKNVSIRTSAWVRRIVHDASENKRKASGVIYIDANGQEVLQPAELIFLASWTLNNTRLLLLSGIGKAYDPTTGKGSLGRNLTHQVAFSAATAFFETPLNRFMGSGASGIMLGDLDGDVFDHSKLPFLRGGTLGARSARALPISECGVVPKSVKATWGSEWKKAALYYYDRTGRIGFSGEHLAYKDNYMDLDPVYKDHFGDPLLRLTLDWRENERKMADHMIAKAMELAREMGAKEVTPFSGLRNYDATRYQSSHVQGGAIMGSSPELSVVNPYLQHWKLSNLFVLGASSFPQNASANPTPTILALTYRTADAVVDQYLKNPAALA